MNHSIVTTIDGSHTIYNKTLDEHYHSTHGAIQEAELVYIQNALGYSKKQNISIFEVGFGTGLNAFLSAIHASEQKRKIHYITIEKFPIQKEMVSELNYTSFFKEEYKSLFHSIHSCIWEKKEVINEYFSIHKIEGDLLDFPIIPQYDIVYFDAFAPNKQDEMWSLEIFEYLFQNMNENGIITTYCAKGEVRRMLQQSGFTMERIPGPPGKREMLRGMKLF